jgi:pyruvate dehydrogenase E2 component (dihydrolipoamide acetyltransferase)
MKTFNLPDLGEGLPDAEIREWFVKEGDVVKMHDNIVSMETAKAVVDVPTPIAGKIVKLFGKPGDIIPTGSPLIGFEGEGEVGTEKREDTGTVAGTIETGSKVVEESVKIIRSNIAGSAHKKAPPVIVGLAHHLGVDLNTVQGTGTNGMITARDVKLAANGNVATATVTSEGFEPLKGSRRIMAQAMQTSHAQITPVAIFDEADIGDWDEHQDISVRMIRAIVHACQQEPSLNAHFETASQARKLFSEVNLGIAVDSEEGLFVPVIHHAEKLISDPQQLRSQLNALKQQVRDRSIPAEHLKGATITLSNFGTFAGRYATPIIVPPQVAIIGCGKKFQGVVAKDGQPAVRPILPISLTTDHRAVTGGEATRFLGALLQDLSVAE